MREPMMIYDERLNEKTKVLLQMKIKKNNITHEREPVLHM